MKNALVEGIKEREAITIAMIKVPKRLAIVPSTLIAPSVPTGAGLKVVIKKVLLPNLLPSSLPKV